MKGVSIGNNMKFNARSADRGRIQEFYGDVLGCEVFKKEGVDFVRLSNDFYVGIIYDDQTVIQPDPMKSTWLEVRTSNPDDVIKKILHFGAKEIKGRGEYFYFQAPDGQVFRLAPNDMENGWGLHR